MKIYLDDERATPDGWHRAYWPEEVISHLQNGYVTEVSLDHDLGDDDHGTGYDVILWIEEAVALKGFIPPKIHVHSANSSAVAKMLAGVKAIGRLADSGQASPSENRTDS
ncbi:cyclic-phosphate processing receiver domain-containing protein [Pseudomonas luteola]|uniref:cyclic-phosphate processing receiver domain-containing protein n=1 Tax=Pseudomonas TaxID=286 RepID=UPI00388D674C